ncbi:golgin subfamily A member 6-like protein 1 [Dendrobium catenatum]|uniref:BAG family molecular chaperone regulator 5, mitochondrial n=1 Tax=Dendrobium catenatum TaxID=906689 RepID=A0A2I0XHJ2_9ASPA|nr:golgin subfamily A member 6-like protein 1 [Dendrobium catenatum]PKU87369.1 BAG family molecular chaperone regulator 5, mitochondrial [Dendrobium catenatum]
MANPFYRSHWNPIRNGYYPQAQIQPESTKPKVISIPVQFVGSDNATRKKTPAPATKTDTATPTGEARVAAAVTIQRSVRGFLVRKNVRLVRQIAGEVEEIERKVREEERKIRLDARERILVSETLMALLLRLDTVRGVRDFRKRVIRRVISLQEKIDFLSAAAVDGPITLSEESSIDLEKTTDQTLHLDEMEEEKTEFDMEMYETVESPKISSDTIATVDGTISRSCADQNLDAEEETHEADTVLEMEILAEAESSERQSDLTEAADGPISSRSLEDDQKSFVKLAEESLIDHEKIADQTLDLELLRRNENDADLEVNIPATLESPKRKSDLIDIDLVQDGSRSSELEEEIHKADEEEASLVVESLEAKREDEMRMREMVERMALENDRLKEMVAQLCSTSSKQFQVMEGLADRLEHLERLVHHRMDRRKKRRSIAPCSALSSAN